ncbi:glycosyltransferase family 39 protein [Candidatus Fermentibacteria bacterium]|nr:glycosyltransferase family 39 protein [Candidatus Fermentibacteria bacterium]
MRPPARTAVLRRIVLSPLTPLLVSMLFSMWRLSNQSLWADEGETFGAALYRLQPYEHPSTYFRFVGLWMRWFGSTEFLLRLPSALSAAGLVLVALGAGRFFEIPRLGLWAAWLAALSPFVRLGAQEARMYAPMAFTQAAALWGLLSYLNGNRRGAYVWAAGTGVSTALHHLGWLACWPLWVAALCFSRTRRPLILAGLLAFGLYAPLLVPTASQVLFRLHGGHMGSTPSFLAAGKKLLGHVYYLGAGYLFTRLDGDSLLALLRSPKAAVFLLQLMIPAVLAVRGSVRLWATARRRTGLLAAFFLPTFLFLGYEGSPANLLLPVYLAYLIPLAAGAATTRPMWVVAMLLLWAPAHVRQIESSGYLLHPEDWRGMAENIRESSTSDDAVFLTGSRNSLFMADYYPMDPARRHSAVDSARAHAPFDAHLPLGGPGIVSVVDSLLSAYSRVWFVHLDWDMPSMERSVDTLWIRSGRWRRRFGEGLELIRLERGAP